MGNGFMDEEFGNVYKKHVPLLAAMKHFARAYGWGEYGVAVLKSVANPLELLSFMAVKRQSAHIRFKDGTRCLLDRTRQKALPRALLMLKSIGKEVHHSEDFSEARFRFEGRQVSLKSSGDGALFVAYRLFLAKKEYPPIDVKGKVVADVGANIGDTAIYFALLGAERVVAFEPVQDICKLAGENIRNNHLGMKVKLVENGVGARGRAMQAGVEGSKGASRISESSMGAAMEIIGLDEAVGKYRLEGAVLKLDCEGAEYEIILESSRETLRKFCTIMVEYHHGYLNLKKRLEECGFRVWLFGAPSYDRNPEWAHPHIRVGILVAERV